MATNTTNDDYLKQIADTRTKLTLCFKEAHEQLTERETTLLRELNKIREEYETSSMRKTEELKDLQDAKDFIMKKITDNETLNANLKHINSRLAAILQTTDTRNISFLWDDDLKRVIQQLGQIKMNDQSTPLLCTFTPGVEPLIPDYKSKCKPVITCCKKYSDAKAPGELYYPRGLALDYLTNGIYLADANHHRVQVFSSNGDYCFMFSVNMNLPWGICISNNIVHVSQHRAHCINLYKIDGTYISKIGSNGTGDGQFTHPTGIAVSEKTEYLYVCDFSNHRVQCFDKNKNFHLNLGIGKFHYPKDVKLTRCTVIILDASDPCVHLFSLEHEPISSVISRGNGKQIGESYFFDIDRETNIIMTDLSSHNVKIFSKLGVLIHQFGKNGEEAGEFQYPYGILLDNKGRIVVVCEKQKGRLEFF